MVVSFICVVPLKLQHRHDKIAAASTEEHAKSLSVDYFHYTRIVVFA